MEDENITNQSSDVATLPLESSPSVNYDKIDNVSAQSSMNKPCMCSFIGVLVVITIFLLYSSALENIVFTTTEASEKSDRTGIAQTGSKMHNNDLLKVQILGNNLENRLKDAAAVLEITGNLSAVRGTPDASLLSSIETLHGIPEDADIEKRRVATNILSNYDDFAALYFFMPNGDLYLVEPFEAQENSTTSNFSFREYYQGAVNTTKAYLGDVIISRGSGLPEADVAIPLYYPNNESLVGVWDGEIDFDPIQDGLQSLNLTNNERVVYVDNDGTKIADSDNELAINTGESFFELKSFKNAVNGKSGSIVEEVNGTEMLVAYHPVKALQNTWVVLWMRPIVNDLTENATATTSGLDSV